MFSKGKWIRMHKIVSKHIKMYLTDITIGNAIIPIIQITAIS